MSENLRNTTPLGKIKKELSVRFPDAVQASPAKKRWLCLLLFVLSLISLPGQGAGTSGARLTGSAEGNFAINQAEETTVSDFSSINWGTAASQPYKVTEGQGETVNGKLYCFGGFDSQKSGYTPTSRAYVYDPALNKWASIAAMPHMNGTQYGGVTHAGFTNDGTNIYFAGGYTSNAAGTGQIFGTKEVWKYIVTENRYQRLPDLPITVAAGQLEYLNGKLHHISGTNAARTADLGNHYELDLNNMAAGWKALAPLPTPRQHAGSAVYEGKIYYIGGQTGHDSKLVAKKDVHRYDPATNTWTKMADLPVPSGATGRGHISSSVVVVGNRILVLGGETVHISGRTNMVSAYTPASNTWRNLTSLPSARFSGVAAWLSGNLYYTGGSSSATTYKGGPAISEPDNSQQVASLKLINADNDQDLQTLTNGSTLNLATLPTKNLNIRANTNPATVGSVKFSLSGTQSKSATESAKPYALFGDNNQGDYYAWTPAVGSYTLKATPYTASKGSGTAGTALAVGFTVVNQAPENNEALISNVSVSNGKKYVVTDLAAGKLMYIDRSYKITAVPSSLAGASLIQTANDDKQNASSSLLSFNLSQSATVYVAYDPRATALPAWLSGWQKLTDRLSVDDSKLSYMNLYSKTFAAGKVSLGGNSASPAAGAQNNYLVMAKESSATSTTSSLVTNVSASTGRKYSLAELSVGEKMYTDRTYQITAVPSLLQQASLIQPANDDKRSTSSALLSFDLSEEAVVYVAYDPRGTALPAWLSGWQKSTERLGVDDSKISNMNLYSKTFAAGKVTLGGNMASPAAGAETNCLVIAMPAGQALAATQATALVAAENQHQALSLHVFPNPSTGSKVYVEVENLAAQETVVITLYDILGHALISRDIITDEGGKAEVEMLLNSQMKRGIYFIKAHAPSGKLQSKLVVQ